MTNPKQFRTTTCSMGLASDQNLDYEIELAICLAEAAIVRKWPPA